MYKETLRAISGIEIFPVISLLLFVAVFTVVLVWTIRLDRSRVDAAASLPLDGADADHDHPAATTPRTTRRSDR
jgi:hypothetical protein